ncbi:MAG: hypothetical protein V2J02_17640 [Pseudomonadales bacterium]|nr:hypothetical protein [Pseudomonadales bacterium]
MTKPISKHSLGVFHSLSALVLDLKTFDRFDRVALHLMLPCIFVVLALFISSLGIEGLVPLLLWTGAVVTTIPVVIEIAAWRTERRLARMKKAECADGSRD